VKRLTAMGWVAGASLLIASCGGGSAAKFTSCLLTVNSSDPSTGVSIGLTSPGNNQTSYLTTSFSQTDDFGASFALTAPAIVGSSVFSSWSGCASTSTVTCAITLNADTTVTANYLTPVMTTPTVTVTPSPASVTTRQAFSVAVAVAGTTGSPTPSGTVSLSGSGYASAVAALGKGSLSFAIPANTLSAGSDTLTAVFTPDAASFPYYPITSGAGLVTVVVPPLIAPTVAVTPSSLSTSSAEAITASVTVSGSGGNATPTGTVTLTSGSYTSASVVLGNGSVTIDLPGGSLMAGSDTLSASYAPDAISSSVYKTAIGTSAAITVIMPSAITVDQTNLGPATSDQILGMNMAVWYDPSNPAILPAFKTAGIRGIRWPGGSAGNEYHWASNSLCAGGTTYPADAFDTFIADVIRPGNFELALTANYSTNAACTGPGDPAEAAAWVQNALANGNFVSHVTVGNENFGSWEPDLHTLRFDPTTYANATATGYYPQIKAVNPNVQVGVSVNPFNPVPWDSIVLAQAKYDFVEYHFYPEAPGSENDTFLVKQAAQLLTTNINLIKTELQTAGSAATPIYIGEIGSVYDDPGVQATSITQALYAGQALGEMMNDGVTHASWWLGFGGCTSDRTVNNFSSSLYGWQNFGGYMVFSDGTPEYGCESATQTAAGTLLPTARAFEVFSKIAVSGENVLSATVAGDTTDVRAYAATSSGGTALLLFNDNETANEALLVQLTGATTASSVTVTTYDKAIYDESKSNVWAAPTTTSLGAKTLPLSLTLAPWSMNVVIVK